MASESPGAFNQASSYGAEQSRRAWFSWAGRTSTNSPGIIRGGLLSAADLQLSAPGSGLSVNVSPGEAIVGGSEGGAQGGYYVRGTSTTNLTISAANPSNPRIDTVCATVSDSAYTEPTGGSGDKWAPQVVTGTATSGATLTNLLGAATLPLSSLLLGYVLVPAGASNIITADIANVATAGQVPGTSVSATPVVASGSQVTVSGWSSGSSGTYLTWSAAGFTVQNAGYYLVMANGTWDTGTTGLREMWVVNTTGPVLKGQVTAPASSVGPSQMTSWIFQCAVNDVLTVTLEQTQGSSVTMGGLSMTAYRLPALPG